MYRITPVRRLISLGALAHRQSPHLKFSTSSRTLDKISFRLDGQGTGVAQNIKVKGSPHDITVDAYASFGGSDSAPSPLAYNLSSLGSCTQVTGSLVAKDLGVTLGEWSVTVKGHLDTDVLVNGKDGNANWDSIELEVSLQTDTTDEGKFQQLASETERRCPITQLFKRSGAGWNSRWVNATI